MPLQATNASYVSYIYFTVRFPSLPYLPAYLPPQKNKIKTHGEYQSLCKLSATVLQRVARGSGPWTELTLDGLNKLMLLVEERLFPGDELAAAMVAAAASGGDGEAGTATGGEGVSGGKEGGDAAKNSPVFETEGGWGEDGTAAGSLSHLVECMLEVW